MAEKQSPEPLAGGDRAGMLCSAASYPAYKAPTNSGQPSSLFSILARLRPLRSPQVAVLEALRRSLAAGKRRPMLQAPTGFGKTLLAAHIVAGALGKGKRVAFCVPRLTLIDQTVAAFDAEGIRAVGVMQSYHPLTDHEQPVQVCSAQTLARRKLPEVDLVLIDEAHEHHKSIFRWMADCPEVPFIGLSATPWSRGLGKFYDSLIVAATTRELIDAGFLSDFVAYAPSDPDLSAISTRAGEFQQDELADAMDKASITGDIIAEWLKRGENRPTIAFCVNRRHAQHVCERFVEAGVAAEYADCDTASEDREEMFARFRCGETKVLCNVGILTTGVDLDVRCIVDAQPTKSRILFTQKIGRGLRTAEGKDKLIILDHGGNNLRLGRVTDIGQTHLDDSSKRKGSTRKERSEPLPKPCPECKAVLGYKARECSACGAKIIAVTEVHEAEGDLVELGARVSGARKATPDDKEAFYRELKWVQSHKGHRSGWWHKYQERFKGERPPKWFDLLTAREPSLSRDSQLAQEPRHRLRQGEARPWLSGEKRKNQTDTFSCTITCSKPTHGARCLHRPEPSMSKLVHATAGPTTAGWRYRFATPRASAIFPGKPPVGPFTSWSISALPRRRGTAD
jgi:DNA repair protein RadD